MDHFGFKVRNLAEVLQAWRAAGLEVGREFIGAEGFPNAYLMAPDDVRIELQEDKALPVKAAAYHLHFLLGRLREAARLVASTRSRSCRASAERLSRLLMCPA